MPGKDSGAAERPCANAERDLSVFGQSEQRRQPLSAFLEIAAYLPEHPQSTGKSQSPFCLALLSQPIQRGPEIVVLGLQPVQPGSLLRTIQLQGRRLRKFQIERLMPLLD